MVYETRNSATMEVNCTIFVTGVKKNEFVMAPT